MATANAKRMAAHLNNFLNWCAANNVLPYIGETGIPKNDDDAAWMADLLHWYQQANGANAWVTAWASGNMWGTSYNLGLHTNSAGSVIDTSSEIIGPVEANPQTIQYKRGVNIAGGEFGTGGTFSNANPGTVGVNYRYPNATDAAYLFSRGVRSVRFPIRIERLQDWSLSNDEPLIAGEVVNVLNACTALQDAGIEVIIEPHNYGRYLYQDGATLRELIYRPARGLDLSVNRVGIEYWRNFWRRFASALVSYSGVIGFDLMNEPHDMDAGRIGYFGVLGIDTAAGGDAGRTRARDNAATHVVVTAYWDRLQPSAGALDSTEVTNLVNSIQDARNKDLRIILEIAIQYPPSFVLTGVPKFKQQGGTEHTGVSANGDAVRDWVWNQAGRNFVHDFISRIWAAIVPSQIDSVRIGGGSLNELQPPAVGGSEPFNYWGYGDAEQSGTNIATGMVQPPVAVRTPFVPYAGGNSAADNATWATWWLDGWKTFMLWLINEHKVAGFTGDIYIMHPSFGLRSNWTPADFGYREAVAQAQDWDRYIAAYQADTRAWPWSTWIDAVDPVSPPVTASDQAAWRYLLNLAIARNKQAKIWGENTGGQSNADMDRVFQSGAIPAGYRGVVWLNDAQLNSGGTDTYANYLARIRDHFNGVSVSGAFLGTVRYDWETDLQGWVGGGAVTPTRVTTEFNDGAASLQVVKTGITAGYNNVRIDGPSPPTGGVLPGSVLRTYIKLAAGTPGNWKARCEWQNTAFAWQAGTFVNLTAGTWVEIQNTFDPPIATDVRNFGIQVEANDATAGSVTFFMDTFAQGTIGAGSVTKSAHEMWEYMSQCGLDSIRNVGDTRTVLVPGHSWSSARFWPSNHPVKWIVDPANNYRYEAHQYFDPDNSGNYQLPSESWASCQSIAIAEGFTDDVGPPPDTTPPVISSVSAIAITTTGTTITWNTDEASDTQVDYGLSTAYGSSTVLNTAMVTSHATNITGLTPNTLYHYRVRSRDAAGNVAVSGDFTFTTAAVVDTTAPIISAITVQAVTSIGAQITWTTDEPANTQVDYGLTTAYGASTPLDTAFVTSHSASLSGLSPSTVYHYRVRSADPSTNQSVSSDFTFTTAAAPADTTPPLISAVSTQAVTDTGAQIIWITDEVSDTQVDYGLTTSYGSSSPLNSALITSHSVSLSGLLPNTIYHYRVRSRDVVNNLAILADFTFTTAPLFVPPPPTGVVSPIIYLATWVEYPTITIVGPIIGPVITNTSIGEFIALDYNLPVGRSIIITLDYGSKRVELDDGTNLIGHVTPGSSLGTFRLEPHPTVLGGINNIVVGGSGITASTHWIMSYRNRYIGF